MRTSPDLISGCSTAAKWTTHEEGRHGEAATA
jgi:hypothetical protein